MAGNPRLPLYGIGHRRPFLSIQDLCLLATSPSIVYPVVDQDGFELVMPTKDKKDLLRAMKEAPGDSALGATTANTAENTQSEDEDASSASHLDADRFKNQLHDMAPHLRQHDVGVGGCRRCRCMQTRCRR